MFGDKSMELWDAMEALCNDPNSGVQRMTPEEIAKEEKQDELDEAMRK